ncbi:MAG: hypothetical protein K0Q59_3880 [Paenibacillus sp.]|jgi:hypothetical protein|nr:hypothetical protein [Paenibacillus sp.]
MEQNLLGMMTHSAATPSRYTRHAQAALSVGYSGVILFEPYGVKLKQKRIYGYVYSPGSHWTKSSRPYPLTAVDLGYYSKGSTVAQSIRVKSLTPIRFTGHASGNKWTIQQHLLASEQLEPYLLPTKPMRSVAEAFAFARQHRIIMIKPINGKGGKGIMKLSAADNGWALQRNGRSLLTGSERTIGAALRRATSGSRYLLQRWIDIRNPEGRVFDIRSLMQKNGSGEWENTGTAVRVGPPSSITSNISGGGSAHDTRTYLQQLFEPDKVDELMNALCELSMHIPAHLEADYGKRFTEFGLDFAIDRSGALWLLEANIKPGKSVIRKVYGETTARRSFLLPFQYAKYLTTRPG